MFGLKNAVYELFGIHYCGLIVPAFTSTILGAHGGNRTRDLSLTKGVLYH